MSERRRALAAWVAVCLIWGTTYLGIRVAIETMPPFLMAGLRWTLAGILFTMALRAGGIRLPPFTVWPAVALMALLLIALGNGAVVWAEQFVTSGMTAVLLASSPFWMTGIEMAIGGERLTGRTILGLVVGFAGILLLVWPELGRGAQSGRFLAGVIAIQVACATWALGSSWSKRHARTENLFAMTALQMLLGGVMMLIAGSAAGEWQHLHFSTRSAIAFFYLTTIGSIGGYAAYAYALKHLSVAFVSLYAYINPIIAVVLGVIILGEPFDARMMVAAAFVLAGVALVHV